MVIAETLRRGQFLRRYKRFFADVLLDDGQTVVAHVPNTGSLRTCLFAGAACVVSESNNPARKLKATLHFVQTPTGWVGVNTSWPNALVHEAWLEKRVPDWQGFTHAQREFKISPASRLDLVLARSAEDLSLKRHLHHIEIKSVTYAEGQTARFPDAVTERGQKHLRDLMELKSQGHGAELVFVVQREDCTSFAPADQIDLIYGKLLREAHQRGVVIRAFVCRIDAAKGVTLDATRPLGLDL